MITDLYFLLLSFFLLKHIREEAAGEGETTKSSTIIFLTNIYTHEMQTSEIVSSFTKNNLRSKTKMSNVVSTLPA